MHVIEIQHSLSISKIYRTLDLHVDYRNIGIHLYLPCNNISSHLISNHGYAKYERGSGGQG